MYILLYISSHLSLMLVGFILYGGFIVGLIWDKTKAYTSSVFIRLN